VETFDSHFTAQTRGSACCFHAINRGNPQTRSARRCSPVLPTSPASWQCLQSSIFLAVAFSFFGFFFFFFDRSSFLSCQAANFPCCLSALQDCVWILPRWRGHGASRIASLAWTPECCLPFLDCC